MHFVRKWWMQKWSEIFWQIFSWHFLHQFSWWEVVDGEFLKKRLGKNEGICRVEPTNQDVRAPLFAQHAKWQQLGLKSFESISERKMNTIASKLAFLVKAHDVSKTQKIWLMWKFCPLSKAPLFDSIRSKKLLCTCRSKIQLILRNSATPISSGVIRDNRPKRDYSKLPSSLSCVAKMQSGRTNIHSIFHFLPKTYHILHKTWFVN